MYSAAALPILSPVSVDCKISGKLHVEVSVELKKEQNTKRNKLEIYKIPPTSV